MANKNKEEALVEVFAYSGKDVPKNYINVVRSRWTRSYKKDNDFMKLVHPPGYYFAYNNYVNLILNRKDTEVRLAVLEEDRDIVLGFSVIERNVLHYVHVPKAYRRQHIATMLVPDGIQWITHLTKIGMRIWSWKLPSARFNPFLVLLFSIFFR